MSQTLEWLNGLRNITSSERGCTRVAYTDWEHQAHEYVWRMMTSQGNFWRVDDAAGNMFILPEWMKRSPDTDVVLVGSHVDTVIEGGWLDGTLGVTVGMEAVCRMVGADPKAPVGLIVFRDEEGVRFNTGLFGSRVFAGLCTREDLAVVDRDGVAVGDVVSDVQGCLHYVPPVRPAAFLECHIEQGLRLIQHDKNIGVVDGIVGIRRLLLRGRGEANHAGTTEMSRRRDALVPVARIVSHLPPLVEDFDDAVITCGRLNVQPGAANIVPGQVDAVVEIRSNATVTTDKIETRFRELVATCAVSFPAIDLEIEPVVEVIPQRADASLAQSLTDALEELNVSYLAMPSMAGHDTQHAAHRCPSAMFFIPSIGGVSHNPAEDSDVADIRRATDVMTAWAHRAVRQFT